MELNDLEKRIFDLEEIIKLLDRRNIRLSERVDELFLKTGVNKPRGALYLADHMFEKELSRLLKSLQPGDRIVLKDGQYGNEIKTYILFLSEEISPE